ncbi:SMC family ATPase [Candidatus Bathyarchaeota archaeon]|nr:SMC family ATPase [Candidatus Bathyarchaeota archaeon]
MMLKALTLENIRSYKDETRIQIPTGTILFEGDIASGKSTILYAIEFALFGLGDIKSSSLLRNGAKRGRVALRFEVDGKEYEVHRSLVKKGRIAQQDECYIDGPNGKAVLSASELKERVLQILGFNEPANPKAQSVIYRYAIFTPQEEMKEVILKKPDERLQTLRKALRIEDYKVASDNTSTLIGRLKERVKYFEGATQDTDSIKKKIEDETKLIAKITAELGPLKQKEADLGEEIKTKNEKLKQLQGESEKIKKAEATIPLFKKQIEDKNGSARQTTEQSQSLKKRIDDTQPKIAELESVKQPTEKSKDELRRTQDDLKTRLRDAQKRKGGFDERIGNLNSILEQKVCPVCERPVEPEEFRTKCEHVIAERSSLDNEISTYEKSITELDLLIDGLGRYETAQSQLSILRSQIRENTGRLEQNNRTVKELNESIKTLQAQLKEALAEVEPLQEILQSTEALDKEAQKLNSKLTEIGKQISAKQASAQNSEEIKRQLQEQLNQKTKWLETVRSLREHNVWLGEYLAPTIENIEKHVMTSINQRFAEQFTRWFQILMDDPDMQVRINEDFSPIIEREGYEQDFNALSGGEKTSVALAYRLALNTTVQEVTISGGSNLLILDEPTDGFSKEQLYKIRDILEELKCPQVILVSHEKELEGFADHVFRVQKSDGVSALGGN